jgi:GNAT superfamily N-acetyltransferase
MVGRLSIIFETVDKCVRNDNAPSNCNTASYGVGCCRTLSRPRLRSRESKYIRRVEGIGHNAGKRHSIARQRSRTWVAEDDGRIVAFSIADHKKNTIFALFVLPEYEGRGLGRELLARAVCWLWDHEADVLWLTTGPGTRAARFYERAGWIKTGTDAKCELRCELRRS